MSPEQLSIRSWASQRTVAGGTQLQGGVCCPGGLDGAGEWGSKQELTIGGGSERLRGSWRTEGGGEGRGWDLEGGVPPQGGFREWAHCDA